MNRNPPKIVCLTHVRYEGEVAGVSTIPFMHLGPTLLTVE